MATGMYDNALELFLTGQLDWLTATIKVIIVDHAEYTLDLSAHSTLVDVPVAARIGTSPALASKTAAAGVASAADVTFTALTGPICEAVIVYVEGGSEATSYLLCHIDEGTSFPITPTGIDYTLTWSTGGNGVFKL